MKKTIAKRVISAAIALVMALTLVPFSHLIRIANIAAEGEEPHAVLDKTAVLQPDGTYTITLDAYTTGLLEVETLVDAVPADIILVLDQSASMADAAASYDRYGRSPQYFYHYHISALKEASKRFIQRIYQASVESGVDNRVGIATYAYDVYYDSSTRQWIYYNGTGIFTKSNVSASNPTGFTKYANDTQFKQLSATDYEGALFSVNNADERNTLIAALDSISPVGGTATHRGMEMAYDILDAHKNDTVEIGGNEVPRQKIIVMFSDGAPGYYGFNEEFANRALTYARAAETDMNAKIMTIGLFDIKYFKSCWERSNSYFSTHYWSNIASNHGSTIWVSQEYEETEARITGFMRDIASSPDLFLNVQNAVDLGYNDPSITYNITYLCDGFLQFANEIITQTTTGIRTMGLTDQAVLRDYLSDDFQLNPEDTITTIKAYKTACTGFDAAGKPVFGAREEITDQLNIACDVYGNSLSVTGWDYEANAVYSDNNGAHGYKLIVEVKLVLAKPGVHGFNLPTNKDGITGIYPSPTTIVVPYVDYNGDGRSDLLFPVPKVDISLNVVVYDFGLLMQGIDWFDFFNALDWEIELEYDDNGEPVSYHYKQLVNDVMCVDSHYRQQDTDVYGDYAYNACFPYPGALNEETYANIGRVDLGRYQDDNGNIKGYLQFQATSISPDAFEFASLLKFNPELNDGVEYEWARVVIVPATNVLYDDSIFYEDTNMDVPPLFDDSVTDPSVFTFNDPANGQYVADWSIVGAPLMDDYLYQGFGQGDYGFDFTYGYFAKDDRDGMRGTHQVTVTNDFYEQMRAGGNKSWPSIEFSFTGTGFDLISRTAGNSGVYAVDVVPIDRDWNYIGTVNEDGTKDYVHTVVDTYFSNGNGEPLYQIPVLNVSNLKYCWESENIDPFTGEGDYRFCGTYKVRISAIYTPAFDHGSTRGVATEADVAAIPGLENVHYDLNVISPNSKPLGTKAPLGSFTNVFDGVRVYNPCGPVLSGHGIIETAYSVAESMCGNIGELNPVYMRARDRFIEDNTDLTDEDIINLYIDHNPGSEYSVNISSYIQQGPNSEVYIDENGGVAFTVTGDYDSVFISVKAPQRPVAMFINGNLFDFAGGNIAYDVWGIMHQTELYYDITKYIAAYDGTVVIECMGLSSGESLDPDRDKAILSICGIKLVPSAGGVAPNIVGGQDTFDTAEAIIAGVDGDANHDFTLDISDAVIALRAALGIVSLDNYAVHCADMDNNGVVDTDDVILILRSLLIG
ncbi:MAG: hypothetical protein IKS90_05525 [Clostridia bacterium]|nr:hypothetical protein [Clostridia bacterium]